MAFKIPKVPPTSNKSVRFPNDMLEEVEAAIRGTDCTFSAFVVAAVRAALDDLAEQEQQEKRPQRLQKPSRRSVSKKFFRHAAPSFLRFLSAENLMIKNERHPSWVSFVTIFLPAAPIFFLYR